MRAIRFALWAICVGCASRECLALQAAGDAVRADFFWQQGYTGDGVEIGVLDLYLADSSHPAIDGNFLGSENFVNGAAWLGGHATSVVGAALSQDPARRGVAYNAGWWTGQTTNRGSITSQRTQTVAAETFARGLGSLNGNPVEVLAMSIGLGGNDAANDQWSLGLDHIVSERETTVVVAAGNDGPASGFSGPPGTAYNILSVGATGGSGLTISEDYNQIAPYSSRGPTSDGRRKPDIVAPGSLVELPTLGGGWTESSGTSFAAPLVAGGAALLIDMGLDRGLDVGGLVIKSVLMNSADKLPGWSHTPSAPLDDRFGAGQLNLESAFHQYSAGEHGPGVIGPTGWDRGTKSGGADITYEIGPILPVGATVTATLVWNRDVAASSEDIESAVYTASPLHNLDLLLYESGNHNSPVIESVSTVDNVEHLFLSAPRRGNYQFIVRSVGGSPVDPLDFALAWNIVIPEVPLPGDFNDDGVVNAADYVRWRDTDVTSAGYAEWQGNFGATSGSGASEFVAVPETSGWLLFVFSAVAIAFQRKPDENG